MKSNACKDRDADFRLAQRTRHAVPLLSDLKTWLDEQEFLPKSLIGQAAELLANVVLRESVSGDDFGLNCTGL